MNSARIASEPRMPQKSTRCCSAGGTAIDIGSGRPPIPLAIRVAVPIGLSTPLFTFPNTSANVAPPTGGRSVKIAYRIPPRL